MSFSMIARADDFGSAPSANAAILRGLASGCWIRNVSCMAPGTHIARDAAELARYKDRVDFGLHFTVNSEWDRIQWTPCAPRDQIPSLLDENGSFYQTSLALQAAQPSLEQLIRELDAQLDRLTALGIPVSYLDGHMFPDRYIPGLDQQMQLWADKKGLLCTNFSFSLWRGSPEFAGTVPEFLKNTRRWLGTQPEGSTLLYIMHPAGNTPETALFANRDFPSGVIAHERELEAQSVVSPLWQQWMQELDIRLLRYSQLPCAQRQA